MCFLVCGINIFNRGVKLGGGLFGERKRINRMEEEGRDRIIGRWILSKCVFCTWKKRCNKTYYHVFFIYHSLKHDFWNNRSKHKAYLDRKQRRPCAHFVMVSTVCCSTSSDQAQGATIILSFLQHTASIILSITLYLRQGWYVYLLIYNSLCSQ